MYCQKNLLCFFFLFCIVFNNFLAISVDIENARLKLVLVIPTDAPIAVANNVTEMLLVVTDKTIKDLTKQTKKKYIYWAFYSLTLIWVGFLGVSFEGR